MNWADKATSTGPALPKETVSSNPSVGHRGNCVWVPFAEKTQTFIEWMQKLSTS